MKNTDVISMDMLKLLQRIEDKQDLLYERVEAKYNKMDGEVDKLKESINVVKSQQKIWGNVIPSILTVIISAFMNYLMGKNRLN